jgi:phosphopantothenoylcysteine decarboxylase/phosphopantothenate--cysteine ligase
VEAVAVRSAEEMHRTALEHAREATVVVKAAAVADYRPVAPSLKKVKRTGGRLTLELEATPDILADLAREKGNRILVGFAAETENVAENARAKLAAKGADIVVANDVTAEGAGFDSETNIVSIFSRDGRQLDLPRMTKLDVANRVLDEVLRLRTSAP